MGTIVIEIELCDGPECEDWCGHTNVTTKVVSPGPGKMTEEFFLFPLRDRCEWEMNTHFGCGVGCCDLHGFAVCSVNEAHKRLQALGFGFRPPA